MQFLFKILCILFFSKKKSIYLVIIIYGVRIIFYFKKFFKFLVNCSLSCFKKIFSLLISTSMLSLFLISFACPLKQELQNLILNLFELMLKLQAPTSKIAKMSPSLTFINEFIKYLKIHKLDQLY